MEKRKCPYCGEEMVPGKICARESTGLLFRASCAPRFLKNYELGVTDFFRWDSLLRIFRENPARPDT